MLPILTTENLTHIKIIYNEDRYVSGITKGEDICQDIKMPNMLIFSGKQFGLCVARDLNAGE